MKTLRKKLLFSIAFVVGTIVAFSQTTENSYVVNQEVAIGGSSLFYVPISGVPNGATITNVEAKFDYIAYGVVQNYVSCRFNKDSDPGTGGGVVLVSRKLASRKSWYLRLLFLLKLEWANRYKY